MTMLSQLRLSDLSNNQLFMVELTEAHKNRISEIASDMCKNPVGFFGRYVKPLLVPIRTDSLENFATDLFLPSTHYVIFKVVDTVKFFFAAIGAFFLDLATLPIRFITAAPWYLFSDEKGSNPLYKYLYAEVTKDRPQQEQLEAVDGVQLFGNFNKTERRGDLNFLTERVEIRGTCHFANVFGAESDIHVIHLE